MSSLEEMLGNISLYQDNERINRELNELGYGENDTLNIEDLNKVDQMHYHGTQAVDDSIRLLNIKSDHQVLEIGSGFGGPSRHIAWKTKCQITALEIQKELNTCAQDLTRRCNLAENITHICGDILSVDDNIGAQYDVIVSWLVFLHIKEKEQLFAACYKHLKPGGKMYIEDYWINSPLTKDEDSRLQEVVYCPSLLSKISYQQHLEKVGFRAQMIDLTSSWEEFTSERLTMFRKNYSRNLRVHPEKTVKGLELFYETVKNLFTEKHLGGGRIVVEKI